MKKEAIITKSKYISGLQCLKLFWITFNDKKRIPEPDICQQHIFDQGNMVGDLAKKLYPGGVNVSYERGMFFQNIKQTNKFLSLGKPLFEAGILAENVYARIDILRPSGEGKWDIIEVKASTSAKDVHLYDIAFQKYCCQLAGLKINKCFLLHINNQYVKNGQINPEEFFKEKEVTAELDFYLQGIDEKLRKMRKVILDESCPQVEIGPYCRDPYECPMLEECWQKLPEDNIFTLYNYGPKKCFPLYASGIKTIKDMSEEELGLKQLIQKRSEQSGQTHIDCEEIKFFLKSLEYPLYFMDFETISPAIPLFDKTRPYQKVPFQFSVHVLNSKETNPAHHNFLAKSKEDPRKDFLTELKKVLGQRGTILVYNRGFEEGILHGLSDLFPEHSQWVKDIKARIVDLLKPFKNFSYYNPSQRGSASIKKVLPAVTGKGYDGMEISEGGTASVLYFQATYGNMSTSESEKIYSDLEKYCALDTEGMIWILAELKKCAV